jgi:hypothetical protein
MSSTPPSPLTHPLYTDPSLPPPSSPVITISPFSSPNDALVAPQQPRKGKEKEAVGEEDDRAEDDDDDDDASFAGEKEDGEEASAEYPPVNDEEAETRRVEEVNPRLSLSLAFALKSHLAQNLRQWEVAERERRKAARESLGFARPPSFVDDLAHLLWPGRTKSTSSSSTAGRRGGDPALGKHIVLQSQESLAMDNIPPSPSPTLTPSIVSPRLSIDPSLADPFVSPTDESASTQIQPHSPALMTEFSPESPTALRWPQGPPPPPPPPTEAEETASAQPTSVQPRRIPPPKPLGLPPPRTPPPRTDISPPPTVTIRSPTGETVAIKPARWWHEWLCGCGEGPDRGGEDQVRNSFFPH